MAVLGVVEFSSIALGIRAADAMVKAAPVELLECHPIDPGKYLAAVTGDVASVQASVLAGTANAGPGAVIESFVLPNLHAGVLAALEGECPKPERDAVGVLETVTASSIIEAADGALKAAPVVLITLHLALHIGGKGYAVVAGDVADVDAAIAAGAELAGKDLAERVVIPNPYPELFAQLVRPSSAWKGGAKK